MYLAELCSPALAHTRLRGQMEDVCDTTQQRFEVGILDPSLDEPEPTTSVVDVKVRFLDVARVVVSEAVEPDDLRALIQQRRREV